MKKIGLLGIAYNVPDKVLTNSDLEKMVDTTDEWITKRTGIKRRHIISDPKIATSDVILPAAERAIERSKIDKEDIDAVLIGTVTPDYFFPSTAAMVQKKLGIKQAMIMDFEAACSGFLYGLDIARGLILSGNYKNILVVAADLLTKITNWDDRNTCVLFGDGAGAAVVGKREDAHELIDVLSSGDGKLGDLLILHGGGTVNPMTKEMLDKKLQYLSMDKGAEVFKWAILEMTRISNKILEKNDYTSDDVDWLVPHQANIRIMEGVAKRLNIPIEKVVITIQDFGNTSASSVPIALSKYYEDGKIKEGQLLLLTAFGGGFTWGSALIRW
jgi:3-oxoacyl-[acyl-carrier-protein] synthase-3